MRRSTEFPGWVEDNKHLLEGKKVLSHSRSLLLSYLTACQCDATQLYICYYICPASNPDTCPRHILVFAAAAHADVLRPLQI